MCGFVKGETYHEYMQGAKAGFSFDERFVVTHHYVNGNSTANLYLYDLQTQQVKQITWDLKFKEGQLIQNLIW